MYECSGACCDRDHYNMEEVQRCVEKCSEPISKTQSFIEGEMSNFQVSSICCILVLEVQFYYINCLLLTKSNLIKSYTVLPHQHVKFSFSILFKLTQNSLFQLVSAYTVSEILQTE